MVNKNEKCANCWFYHKGKHKAIDSDGILRDFDGICSNMNYAEILPLKVKSVFDKDLCDLYQNYMSVIKRIAKTENDEQQKTLDSVGVGL